MNADFGYFVDHLPSIITAIFSGVIMLRQAGTKRSIGTINQTTQETHADIRNGAGEKMAERAMECMRPAFAEEAEKLKNTAKDVAAALVQNAAFDGVERRVGDKDRRKG